MEWDDGWLTDPAAMTQIREVEHVTRRMVRHRFGGWSPADQDDLVSVVLEKYFKKWGRGPGPAPLGPWLKPVVRNAGIDLFRARPKNPFRARPKPDVLLTKLPLVDSSHGRVGFSALPHLDGLRLTGAASDLLLE